MGRSRLQSCCSRVSKLVLRVVPTVMTPSTLPPLQAHSPSLEGAQGHCGILSAAKGVLADLERHQILRTLLTGRCRPEGDGQHGAANGDEQHGEARRTPEVCADQPAVYSQSGQGA